MHKDKIINWINSNDFWKNEFVNYRNSNLDILFNPKHKNVKNKFEYFQSVYGYVTFEENESKYNPLDVSEESFKEYRAMNKLYNSLGKEKIKKNPEEELYYSEIKKILDEKSDISESIQGYFLYQNKLHFCLMMKHLDYIFKSIDCSKFSRAMFKASPKNTFKNSRVILNHMNRYFKK